MGLYSYVLKAFEWIEKHEDAALEEDWGSWREIALWTLVILAHIGFIAFVAWRLAVRHTEATGSSVLVPVRAPSQDLDEGIATTVVGSQISKARKRGSKD